MKVKKILITGDAGFCHRYQYLLKPLSSCFNFIDYLSVDSFYEAGSSKKNLKLLYAISSLIAGGKIGGFRKNATTFIKRSRQTEYEIKKLNYTPDLVFHFFSLYSPFWNDFNIPYTMYLDYTMALANKNWSPWAPSNLQELRDWLDCELIAYKQAIHIFTMSNLVKSSLVNNYGIKPEKITVVGSSGHFQSPYQGKKVFGSKQILFNASDFSRKGGDIVLAAFEQVKRIIPDTKLVLVGKKLTINKDGVINPGSVSSTELKRIFLETDLVVAPARCDPFPAFLIEAMNYGIPCIVTDCDGMPEIIDNGINGIVINQHNPDILADKVVNLLRDIPTLTLMSKNAQQKVRTQLNWDNIAMSILQVISKSNL